MQGAEHGNDILADSGIFAQTDAAEKADKIVLDEPSSSALTLPKKLTTS